LHMRTNLCRCCLLDLSVRAHTLGQAVTGQVQGSQHDCAIKDLHLANFVGREQRRHTSGYCWRG